MTPEERVLDAYYERLSAYAVDKSRVIVVEFQSQRSRACRARRQFDRRRLSRAPAECAPGAGAQAPASGCRAKSKICARRSPTPKPRSRTSAPSRSLFVGTNNTTLSNQQMGEVNTQLNNARALKADAESRARLIKEMLQSGKPIEASEVRELRVDAAAVGAAGDAARAACRTIVDAARQSSAHQGIEGAARRSRSANSRRGGQDLALARKRRADRRRPGRRPDRAASSSSRSRRPRPTARTCSSARSSARPRRSATCSRPISAKYREASTRESIDAAPAEARIISRAIVSNTPAYPKKLPIVLIATLATLLLSSGLVVTGELLRQTAPRAIASLAPAPVRGSPVSRSVDPVVRSEHACSRCSRR